MDLRAPSCTHITEGLLGVAAPVLGVITSVQEQLEYWLRISSLAVGMLVGLVTLYRILRPPPKL